MQCSRSLRPVHRHHDDDESFYVLDGTMTLFLEGGRVLGAGPGSFVCIPHGVAHGLHLGRVEIAKHGPVMSLAGDGQHAVHNGEMRGIAAPDLLRQIVSLVLFALALGVLFQVALSASLPAVLATSAVITAVTTSARIRHDRPNAGLRRRVARIA